MTSIHVVVRAEPLPFEISDAGARAPFAMMRYTAVCTTSEHGPV